MLGSGGLADVYQHDGFAIKRFRKTANDNGILPEVVREISILSRANHPNLIRCVKIHMNESIEITLEHGCVSLYDYIEMNISIVRNKNAPIILQQILRGLQYMHETLAVAHRDIKPTNILISEELLVRICDFGSCKEHSLPTTPRTGTINYRAPELFLNQEIIPQALDIWAAGCCIFQLCTGYMPFRGETEIAVLGEIRAAVEFGRINVCFQNVTVHGNFVKHALQTTPSHRPKASEALSWFHDPVSDARTHAHQIQNHERWSDTQFTSYLSMYVPKITQLSSQYSAPYATHLFERLLARVYENQQVKQRALRALEYIWMVCCVISSKLHDVNSLHYLDYTTPKLLPVYLEWELQVLKILNYVI